MALFAQVALLPLTTVRAASIGQLKEDLAAGEVTALFFGDRVDPAHVLGRQPRRATRWATFWRVLLPLNTGARSIVLREAPWNPVTEAEPEPLPHGKAHHDPRPTGGRPSAGSS